MSPHTCQGCRELIGRLEVLVPLLEATLLPSAPTEILDAAGVAKRYGLSREWVYRHKTALGGWTVGDGPRPRWRFDAAEVEVALRGAAPTPRRAKACNRRPRSSTTPLLPIKGGKG